MPETTRHREAFDLYWRLGSGRSIERLRTEMARLGRRPPTLRTLYEWSRRYAWQHRIADLERKARDVQDEQRIAAIREMEERHRKQGLFLQQKGLTWLEALPDEKTTGDIAVRALIEGIKIERLVSGEPTERTAIQGRDPRLERFSDGALERLVELADRELERAGDTEP